MCWTNVYQEQCAGVADSATDLRQDPLNAILSLYGLSLHINVVPIS